MNEKKPKKKTPPPFVTYGLAGGRPLNNEAGTTKPTADSAEEMRSWSEQHEQ